MAASPVFAARIPVDLFVQIETHVNQTGKSKAAVLIEALSLYLDRPQLPTDPEAFALYRQVMALDARLKVLEAAMLNAQVPQSDQPLQSAPRRRVKS
jgi:hypothetical protein